MGIWQTGTAGHPLPCVPPSRWPEARDSSAGPALSKSLPDN